MNLAFGRRYAGSPPGAAGPAPDPRRQDLETARDGGGELAGAQQEIGVARLAEALIAPGEGLIEQQPTRRDGTDDVGQEGRCR